MKMSKSQAGKLGAEKSKIINEIKKHNKITEYNKSPFLCINCQNSISFEKRKNKFCSHSCAGLYNNARKDWENIKTGPIPKNQDCTELYKNNNYVYIGGKVKWLCLNCLKEHTSPKHRAGKFCDIKCQKSFEYKEKIKNWENVAPGTGIIKKYLKETFGNKCSICSISSWNNKEIVLELEHRDGNSQNNSKENVCLICPNCHSQTPTYKGKNKGNGRHLRKQRYSLGKSY